jgi:GTP-binding protein
MIIKAAKYFKSSGSINDCPKSELPEFAFIGRSNVGKSSLINMLADNKKLAHISSNPGKTQCINHYVMNDKWFLVDLPGYGYAKVSKVKRSVFSKMITDYLSKRKTLLTIVVLVDSRIEPQEIDLEFIDWLGKKELPFVIAFTKSDKAGSTKTETNIGLFKKALQETWQEMPYMIITSAEKKKGKEELLGFIDETIKDHKLTVKESKDQDEITKAEKIIEGKRIIETNEEDGFEDDFYAKDCFNV